MRDSIGSVVVLAIVVVFVVFVSGYMAFNVNYTKAFRLKNKIIDVIESNDGVLDSDCKSVIRQYADKIGYDYNDLSVRIDCPEWGDNGYCVEKIPIEKMCEPSDDRCVSDIGNRYYYRITTYINIRIPIIQNTLGLNFFTITGDTKQFAE